MDEKLPLVIFPQKKESSEQEGVKKKRRVSRACDYCRQKKVKCDGKQPCIHCTVYSYHCTYDQPHLRNKRTNVAVSNQNRGNPSLPSINESPSSNNIEDLRLLTAQKLLNLILPNLKIDLINDKTPIDILKFEKSIQAAKAQSPLVFRELEESISNGFFLHSPMSDHSNSSFSDEHGIKEFKLVLPTKEKALELVYTTWNRACVLFRFYHRPSLLQEIDLLYSLDPSHYGNRQQRFLPFLYSIFAVGSLFSKSSNSEENQLLEESGFKYFLEARRLIDITNVGDINSIQTTIMMTIYLQCSARLSTCYLYIGVALRSAIKEGLHRDLSILETSNRKFDAIEVDTRKRLFYTIYKMDIYINSLLGLPLSLEEDEYDQKLPPDLDDENITREGYLYDRQGDKLSSAGCANFHTKLMLVLAKIIKSLYPIKITNIASTPDTLHKTVSELELLLKIWNDSLPQQFKLREDYNDVGIPSKFVLAKYYLHLSFLNCQIFLYRPFIHSINGNVDFQPTDPRSLIRGRNCIKVARMVVKLANMMIEKDLLTGTYWFSTYTIFFSIACLVYYYHFANYSNNPNGANYAGVLFDDDLNVSMIEKDIRIGKRVLDQLKNSSNSALRIYNILNNLFEMLNRRTANNEGREVGVGISNPSSLVSPDADIKGLFENFDNVNNIESSGNAVFQNKPATAPTQTTTDKNDTFQEIGYGPALALQLSDMNPRDSYVPGVMDKIDTQIFGRILPPYMLEENVKKTGKDNDPGAVDSPKMSNISDLSQLNIMDLDFSLIQDLNFLDDINGLPLNTE